MNSPRTSRDIKLFQKNIIFMQWGLAIVFGYE